MASDFEDLEHRIKSMLSAQDANKAQGPNGINFT